VTFSRTSEDLKALRLQVISIWQ